MEAHPKETRVDTGDAAMTNGSRRDHQIRNHR
ncbi:hypothetical protein A2U01_0114843, partial [Trifolium medium]|nr:hypothetical protein [Trifolium medium]